MATEALITDTFQVELSAKELAMVIDSLELNAAVTRQKGMSEILAFVNDEVLQTANELSDLHLRLLELHDDLANQGD